MAGRECYHCKQWIEAGEAHDCWTTTEHALTKDLSEDLREAWERLRETAVEFGEQRIYASHRSIMFSRRACYFFVRPGPKYLEVWFFLARPLKAAQVRKVVQTSRVRVAHMVRIVHRDEVEAPITDWLREAYDAGLTPRASRAPRSSADEATKATKKAATKNTKRAATKNTKGTRKRSAQRTAAGKR